MVKLTQGHNNRQAGHSAFAMALCLLGVMALFQFVIVGTALAIRFKESGGVHVVEREVIREVPVHVERQDANDDVSQRESGSAFNSGDAAPSLPHFSMHEMPPLQPSPLEEPEVEDPDAARLLKEAREARVASDMRTAVVKLEQALEFSPAEPSVVYELAKVHEDMGIFDRAGDYYLRVYQMGRTKAGVLYEMAASKVRDGISQPSDMRRKLSLGRVHAFQDPKHRGKQVVLTIPVQKAPDVEVKKDAIQVQVRFFNKNSRNEIVELDDRSWVSEPQWVTGTWDWAGGEEQCRMTYTIPANDLVTEQLFGELSYYGYVVILNYEDEVLCVHAFPSDLAARIPPTPQPGLGDLPLPNILHDLPPGFDPSVPLLPLPE